MKSKRQTATLTPGQERTVQTEKLFAEWWNSEGRYIDPDPEVDWYDKRREFAYYAFRAARNHD